MRCLHDLTFEKIREKLRPVRCFLLDMDGTFYLGDRLIEGSLDFLEAVRRTGRRALFLTNNSSRSVEHYVLKLRRLGVEADPEDILTSGQAAAHYLLREHPGKRVFLLGNPSLREEMLRLGVPLDDEQPEMVLVGFDTTLDYAKMCKVCDLVRAGLPYVATHPDFNCPTESGFVPDIGAIMAFIEASCGRKADVVIGKPHPEIVRAAQERTGLGRESLAMAGDRLYTDVATGVNHGLCSILVLSGESGLADIDRYGIEPDLIFNQLGDMIPYL